MPMKMKSMKGIDLFCASPASTAICSSTDQYSMVRNGHKHLNRINTYLGDHYKTFTNNLYSNTNTYSPSTRAAPCISELPITPRRTSHRAERARKLDLASRRKSSADVNDLLHEKKASSQGHSSRYLLGESPFLDSLSSSSDYENKMKDSLALVPSTPVLLSDERELRKCRSEKTTARLCSLMDAEIKEKTNHNNNKKDVANMSLVVVNHYGDQKPKQFSEKIISKNGDFGQRQKSLLGPSKNDSQLIKSSSSSRARDQVVVLRVSLHCKGCEGKLKKHLSKMEGVKSFSIDLETKKVTVVGNLTPVGVLTSISKVKNAQFWPTPASASSASSSSRSSSSTSSSSVDFSY